MCNNKLNLNVILSKVEHRGQARIKIVFPYRDDVVERVKRINQRQWSQTI
jgi:hypothetical protein